MPVHPDESTWPALFEAQVGRTPGATALVFDDVALTYDELDEAANRLAHLLIGRGAGAERIVGLAVPRSPEMIVAQVAVLKAGAAYLPLDADYPAERLAYMLGDAAPVCLVTTVGLAGCASRHRGAGRPPGRPGDRGRAGGRPVHRAVGG